MNRIALLIVLLATCAHFSVAITYPKRSCSPDGKEPIWLNTTTVATRVDGAWINFYALKPDGTAYTDMSGGIGISHLGEVMPVNETATGFPPCSSPQALELPSFGLWERSKRVIRHFNLSEAYCDISLFNTTTRTGLKQYSVLVNVTDPRFPDFYFEIYASHFNETRNETMEETSNIPGGYVIERSANKIKLEMVIQNWPWITDEQPEKEYGDSYLVVFYDSTTTFDPKGQVNVYDDVIGNSKADQDKYIHYRAIGQQAMIEMDFLKVFGVGNSTHTVDVLPNTNDVPAHVRRLMPWPASGSLSLPAILSVCQGPNPIVPRPSTITYDPSLNAIFFSTAGTTPGPKNKKSTLHPAAYAVPIAAAVLIIIIGAVLIFVVRPAIIKSRTQSTLAAVTAIR